MLTDTHCHLDMIEDKKIALLRAKEAGVRMIINVGTSIDASRQSIEIAEGTDLVDVYATCGIHAQEGPKDIDKYGSLDKCMDELRNMITSHSERSEESEMENRSFGLRPQDDKGGVQDDKKKVVGIGECGMDYFLEATDKGPATSEEEKKAQIELFEAQVKLAIELDLPLIIHCRNAWDETFEIIEKFSTSSNNMKTDSGVASLPRKRELIFSTDSKMTGGVRGLFHSWTGTVGQAKRALDLGFYISISGIVTFKNAGVITEVAKMVPDDRILVETDSPFLSPVPLRGKQNEPKNVRITAQFLAELRGIPLDAFSKITTDNAKNLFRIS